MQIIPAINAPDFETAKNLILKAKEFLPPNGSLHIDVVDGKFSPASVWDNPEELKNLIAEEPWLRKIKIEIHLMVMHPEQVIESWLAAGASRVIVHKEAVIDANLILETCKQFGAEVMIAIKPETPAEDLKPFFKKFKAFQVLAVTPGWAGQKFKPEIVNKIKFLREEAPNATIEVDGGLNPQTVKICKNAGADLFVSASYIFNSDNPKKAFEDLRIATN